MEKDELFPCVIELFATVRYFFFLNVLGFISEAFKAQRWIFPGWMEIKPPMKPHKLCATAIPLLPLSTFHLMYLSDRPHPHEA